MFLVLTLLVLTVLIVAVTVLLPYFNGLTTIEVHKKRQASKKKKLADSAPIMTGYVPPDAVTSSSSTEKQPRFKVKVTSDDMPLHIKLDHAPGLRKRREKLDTNQDPNSYDYDIDELIEDDDREEREENERKQREYYRNEKIGKSSEEIV